MHTFLIFSGETGSFMICLVEISTGKKESIQLNRIDYVGTKIKHAINPARSCVHEISLDAGTYAI